MIPYLLHLNKTHLLFIPASHPALSSEPPSGTVVQMSLRSSTQNTHTHDSVLFSMEQQRITNTVETLLFSHINGASKLPEKIVINNSLAGYTLVGVRKPWKYGRGKRFLLNTNCLRPAEDKWIFTFEVRR